MGWTWFVEDAFLVHSPDEKKPWIRPPYITKTEKDEPWLTTDEEIDLMNEEINKSLGFDIDYSLFRCLFNYHPVELEENEFVGLDRKFVEEKSNEELLTRLTRKSLEIYNQENKTEYVFVKIDHANFHLSSGVMFLITFQVKDPADKLIKMFQARVLYSIFYEHEYVFCRPKPNQEVSSGGDSVGDAEASGKKPRYIIFPTRVGAFMGMPQKSTAPNNNNLFRFGVDVFLQSIKGRPAKITTIFLALVLSR
ncbi:unnamed protein product [Thlaspi arvense]|uniref:Cystatin domain-containing protein n=1 Tax=Thlaspi arvense TaxID=13288 RepID=A0AAU9RUD1_THLAR|nr:unnamed protein product [Thlaspi arvense]